MGLSLMNRVFPLDLASAAVERKYLETQTALGIDVVVGSGGLLGYFHLIAKGLGGGQVNKVTPDDGCRMT